MPLKTNLRLGVVDFLNTTPLISGMEHVDEVEFIRKVPSELIGCLERREVDIAIASSIDYQRSKADLRILPVGVLSSEGETLTVQLCSNVPLEQITKVHCDTDSHTSIILLQIILKHKYGIAPKIIPSETVGIAEPPPLLAVFILLPLAHAPAVIMFVDLVYSSV